jgi:hypothetical protein
MLGRLDVDDAEIERMRAGEPPSDATLVATYELARRIVLDRGRVDDDVVARATAAGLGTAEILEILAECALASLVGLMDNFAGYIDLDAFLTARAWSAEPGNWAGPLARAAAQRGSSDSPKFSTSRKSRTWERAIAPSWRTRL